MHLISMNVSVEIFYLSITATILTAVVVVAFFIINKRNLKTKPEKPYEISSKAYKEYQDISKSALSNTTLTFSSEDSSLGLEIDRGYAGYENVVRKGVELLKNEGLRIPSLGVSDDE